MQTRDERVLKHQGPEALAARKARQRASHLMPKCRCGAAGRLGSSPPMCGRCAREIEDAELRAD